MAKSIAPNEEDGAALAEDNTARAASRAVDIAPRHFANGKAPGASLAYQRFKLSQPRQFR